MDRIEKLGPLEIEKQSFRIIGEELAQMNVELDVELAPVIKRCIHTTADFDYAHTLTFSDNAINVIKQLIKDGADIITDTNMALSGINKSELNFYGGNAYCFMADKDVVCAAKERGCTRAYVSMEKASTHHKKCIIVSGNAPTALIAIRDMYDQGIYRPEFVIGVPVGFVNVVASKELIMETDIPYIVNKGRKGGSNVAAAIVNAVLYELREERIESGNI